MPCASCKMVLLGLVADTGGILLALVWTAGFLPTFLEPGAASVLLAKPVPRWSLLAGKFLGILIFVAFQALFLSPPSGWRWAVHRSLGGPASGRAGAAVALRCLLQLLGAAGGDDAQHGGLCLRLGAVLAGVPGHEPWPSHCPDGAGVAKYVAGLLVPGGCRLLDPAEAGRHGRAAGGRRCRRQRSSHAPSTWPLWRTRGHGIRWGRCWLPSPLPSSCSAWPPASSSLRTTDGLPLQGWRIDKLQRDAAFRKGFTGGVRVMRALLCSGWWWGWLW